MKIALTGPMYSGKSTLAKYLQDHAGFYWMNYTDHLKHLAARALTAAGVPTTVEQLVANKARYREFLQVFGTAVGFDEGFGVQQCLDAWVEAGRPEHVVFDNVRFKRQWELLLAEGYVLVGLHVSEETVTRRAAGKGVSYQQLRQMAQHRAESGVTPEIWLDANRDTRELAETLLRLGGFPLPTIEFEEVRMEDGRLFYRV